VSPEVATEAPAGVVSPEALDRLARFEPGDARVLTAYLDLGPERRAGRTWAIVLKDLAHEQREGLDRKERTVLDAEVERVRTWLDDVAPGGRGVVVFSCSSRELWETFRLPAVERDELTYQRTPHLAPLVDIVEDYERYAVAVVDKERARLFTVFMGQIEETEAFEDEVPGKHEQGGRSQMQYQRDHEKHVLWHLKRVVEELTRLLERKAFDRLIVAGPQEATSELRTLLPHDLTTRLVDVVPMDSSANTSRILEATLEIERRFEREAEDRFVGDLLDAVGPGGLGSCGIAPTLEALWAGSIRTLVISDGLRVIGSACPNCGYLQADIVERCPMCDTAMRSGDDIVDIAVRRTLDTNGEVEVVHDDAAKGLTERCGGMGAVLRFRAG
jgi:peptide chain release factor subunit 1